MIETDELRLRVPKKLKLTFKKLAKAKNITLNDLGILLIHQLLEKKPDLLSGLHTLVINNLSDQQINLSYRRLISAYSLLMTESPQNTEKFLNKASYFIGESNDFIEQLSNVSKKRGNQL